MRPHCSSIAKFLRYTIFDGARFWVINAKKEHLLTYTLLDKNALICGLFGGFALEPVTRKMGQPIFFKRRLGHVFVFF